MFRFSECKNFSVWATTSKNANPKRFLFAGCNINLPFLTTILFVVGLLASPHAAFAQHASSEFTSSLNLPEAPVSHLPAQSSEQTNPSATANPSDSASITGTVEDANGDVIQGAHVVLSAHNAPDRAMISGDNGQFTFSDLPTGTYALAVTGPGWGSYLLPNIHVAIGETRSLAHVVLPLSNAVTEVHVGGSPVELSQEQVQIAIQQRALGVFPNFYSSFDWNAPPMLTKQKYALAFRSMIDPVTFIGSGVIAGVEQAKDTFPGYGQGSVGYARRYGAAYANSFSGRMLGGAVFPALFHQDPRYFYKGSGSVFSRAFYALSTAFITKADNGSWQPNYSHVLGNFTAGALSNLYYPASSRGLSLTLINGALETAGDAGTDFIREFFLRGITSHVPNYNNGKP
uniref:Carboxypeptidase regulatory-like domain-containing protein n=1 Tax=mine drainage metagenome TaxID=410659 RepID=E6QI44_9ZZZZ